MKYLLVEDPSSPLKKEAIEKRNLKIHEITSRGKVDEWKKSEQKRGGRIENWEEDQIRKEMERFNLWNGGAIYEKKMGVFVVRFETWGQKRWNAFIKNRMVIFECARFKKKNNYNKNARFNSAHARHEPAFYKKKLINP